MHPLARVTGLIHKIEDVCQQSAFIRLHPSAWGSLLMNPDKLKFLNLRRGI
jgi:hypothetical protein